MNGDMSLAMLAAALFMLLLFPRGSNCRLTTACRPT